MSEGFGILAKMDPMARKALASIEAMQKAIDCNNRDDIAKHLDNAKNALEILSGDLELHDNLMKHMSNEPEHYDKQIGAILKYENTDGNYTVNDGAIALGVVRPGRTDKVFRPHIVY
jgi:hypothetical protein